MCRVQAQSRWVTVGRSDYFGRTIGWYLYKLFKMKELQIKQPSGWSYLLEGGQTGGIRRFKVASQAPN
jgi:hypothetical protein